MASLRIRSAITKRKSVDREIDELPAYAVVLEVKLATLLSENSLAHQTKLIFHSLRQLPLGVVGLVWGHRDELA
jgi:hypothetical protein